VKVKELSLYLPTVCIKYEYGTVSIYNLLLISRHIDSKRISSRSFCAGINKRSAKTRIQQSTATGFVDDPKPNHRFGNH
jgi:hypothetical protein